MVYSLKTAPKRKIKRIYVVIAVAALLVAALSYGFYTLTMSSRTGPGPVDIVVVADQPVYLQGDLVQFSIYVNNTHDWRVIEPSTVQYQIANDTQTVNIDQTNPAPTFAAHSSTLLQIHTWDQKTNSSGNRIQVSPGNYTLTVTLGGAVNYGASANCTIEIKPNPQS
jgi:hypothetical protein